MPANRARSIVAERSLEGGLPKVRKVRIQKKRKPGAPVEAVALEPTQPASSRGFDAPTHAYARPAMLGLLTKCFSEEECVTVAVAAPDLESSPAIRRRGLYRPVAPASAPPSSSPRSSDSVPDLFDDDSFPPEAGSSVRLTEPHDRKWMSTAEDRSGEWLPDVFLESERYPDVPAVAASPRSMPTLVEGRRTVRESDVFPVAGVVSPTPASGPASKPRLRSVLRTGSRSRELLAGPVTKDWAVSAPSPVVAPKTSVRVALSARSRTGALVTAAVVVRLLLAINLLAATMQTIEVAEALWAGETLASSLDR